MAASVYGTLLTLIGEPFESAPNPNFAPFLAESWEQTPDGLQMTFNIQPNANFTAPVSHAVEAEDVMFSFDGFLGNNGQEPAPNAAQFNFIDSYEGPDAKTVVVNMNAPSARSVARFADNFNVTIMPRETGDAFDPAETLVGSGPFLFDSWQPDVNVVRTRNPEWWGGPDKPYIDRIELSVLDSAQQVTQFKAGNLDRLQTLSPDAVPGMIQDRADASVDPRKLLGWGYISRGEPRDGTAPWDDPRVRKAMSLALDRDALIEAVYNKTELEGLGLSVPAQWHNILPAGYPGQSVDPRTDSVTGEFIKFDLTEANKLMQAADRGDGFSVAYHYTNVYGAAWTLEAEIIPQMMQEISIDFQTEIVGYYLRSAGGNRVFATNP